MTELRIHVDIAGRTLSAGTAYVSVRRGRVSTTFTYDAAYLSNPAGYDLEPGLLRRSGQHYVDGLPGSFADCAPDRWGRNLIDRRRRAAERDMAQRLPGLTDADYLIGVSDVSRQGNLRVTMGDGPFLDPHDGVPPLVSLPPATTTAAYSSPSSRMRTTSGMSWRGRRRCSTWLTPRGLASRPTA